MSVQNLDHKQLCSIENQEVSKSLSQNMESCGELSGPMFRPILRCYRCDTPYKAIPSPRGYHLLELVRDPLCYSVSRRHICAIPHFVTHRATIVRYPIKYKTEQFCETIATNILRCEKYRCWTSKLGGIGWCLDALHTYPGNRQKAVSCERTDHGAV